MKYPIHLARDPQRLANIVINELETGFAFQVGKIFAMPGDEIIERNHFMPGRDKPVTKM